MNYRSVSHSSRKIRKSIGKLSCRECCVIASPKSNSLLTKAVLILSYQCNAANQDSTVCGSQPYSRDALIWRQPSGLGERRERKITCRTIIMKSMW